MWTLTTPRSGLLLDSFFSSTSVSTNSVSPWKTGVRVRELLGREVGDRLAGDVADAHAERERVDERPDDDVALLLRLGRVDVVEVQRVVVHRDQAEQVIVGLGHGLRRPVLVDVADLELLEVAAVAVRARCLALALVGREGGVSTRCSWGAMMAVGASAGRARDPGRRASRRPTRPPTRSKRGCLLRSAVHSRRLDVWRRSQAPRAGCVSRRQLRAARAAHASAIARLDRRRMADPAFTAASTRVGHLPRTHLSRWWAGGARRAETSDSRATATSAAALGADAPASPSASTSRCRPRAAARPGIAVHRGSTSDRGLRRRPPLHDGRAHARRPRWLRPVRPSSRAPCGRHRCEAFCDSTRSATCSSSARDRAASAACARSSSDLSRRSPRGAAPSGRRCARSSRPAGRGRSCNGRRSRHRPERVGLPLARAADSSSRSTARTHAASSVAARPRPPSRRRPRAASAWHRRPRCPTRRRRRRSDASPTLAGLETPRALAQ